MSASCPDVAMRVCPRRAARGSTLFGDVGPSVAGGALQSTVYRLLQEPRRLAKRYLVDDVYFLAILLRTLRLPRAERVLP